MIQCPICQMINDDQTRFCAECGARLGPGPSAQAAPPPAPPPQVMPPQGQSAPRMNVNAAAPGNAPAPAPPRNQPAYDNQAPQPQERPVKKLRSPLLSGDDDFEEEEEFRGPASSRVPKAPPQSQSQSRPHLHSPLLGDSGQASAPQSSSGRQQHLHSPLLGDAVHDPNQPAPQSASGRQHLHSPLLGDAVHDPSNEQQYIAPASTSSSSGRHHLHSPLLGGGDDEQDYYEEEAPVRKGGLHSPMLGGGGGGGGGRGLRSPILGAAAAGGGQGGQFYEEYDDEPYDEDNPNILRSPLLSSRTDLEHHQPARPQQKAAPKPPSAPPNQNQQYTQGQPAPQRQAPQAPAQAQPGPAYYQQAQSAQMPPQGQFQQSLPPAQQNYQEPAYQGIQDPQSFAQDPQSFAQAPAPVQAPAPQPAPSFASMNNASGPAFVPQPHPAQQLLEQSAAVPSVAPPPAAPPVAAPPAHVSEAFPDMSKYRRGESSNIEYAATPSTVVPVSLPMTAGIPDPAAYLPPELAPGDMQSMQAEPGFVPQSAQAFQPRQGFGNAGQNIAPQGLADPDSLASVSPPASSAPPVSSSASPKLPPSRESAAKLEAPPAKPLKRSSSKLLGGDAYDDDDDRSFDVPSSQQGGSLPSRNFAQGASAQNQSASPIPKMMGGAAIFFALLKMPLLLQYLPSISDPRYTWQTVDLAATTAGLIALGLAFLMSKI